MTPAIDGNRVWRVDTPAGAFLQKLYYPRKGAWREGLRALVARLLGAKSSPRAAVRRRTEERLLRHWRAAGCDVPALVEPADAGLSAGPGLLTEFVEGPQLLELMRRRSALPREQRDPLLRRFGASWAARHRLALKRDDPSLVQEHGTLAHVLVSGERMVTYDLEQAWRPGRPVLAALAKELSGVLRSLARVTEPETLQGDLAALVAGYGDRAQLAAIVGEVLQSPSPWRRLVRRLDRWREERTGKVGGTYPTVERLAALLEGGGL